MSGFSNNLFDDKTIVITGAGNGIGRSALEHFVEAGAKVIAHLGRNPDYKSQLPDGVVGFLGDFTRIDDQSQFIEFVGNETDRIDGLINNAGTMFGRIPADTLTDAQYNDIVELNQTSVVRITKNLIPLLKNADTAAIVNTVSISAAAGGSPGSSIYSATKGFVTTYTKALAKELAPFNIRVNALSPGVIHTDFHERYSTAEKLERTREQIPLKRLGKASDCAPAFLFLASDTLSGYITGQVLEINGGLR
ncbi:MAG: SDR family oxidoreductase [Gammaproteobacteria bacterium]|nr:SDR family oxidoreductase [Gammaproteobacteria bacterium]